MRCGDLGNREEELGQRWGATSQSGQFVGREGRCGRQTPEGRKDQAGQQATQSGGIADAHLFEIEAVRFPTQEQAFNRPSLGVILQTRIGGGQIGQ